jgi:hypothetical protein
MGFPNQVNVQAAIGIPGGFASSNPRFAAIPPGASDFQAGPSGLTVGRFCWQDASGNGTLSNYGAGSVTGFVHRDQQGLITTYLAEAGTTIPAGFPAAAFTGGDFFVTNSGTNQATIGMKAYANFATGLVTFAAAGSPTTATAATSTIAANTTVAAISFTGSISGNVLTVTAVSTGSIYPGTILTGPASLIAGTQVVSQISGTTAGVGTYYVSIQEQTVASSSSFAGTYGILTLGAAPSAQFQSGSVLSGTGVTAGTRVWGLLTGAGGSGSTYVVSPSGTTVSTTITATLNVETVWGAASYGAAGETVIISSEMFD